MKKMIAILMALLVALGAVALGENTTGTDLATGTELAEEEMVLLNGFLVEKGADYVLVKNSYGEEIHVNLTEDVAFMAEDLVIGDYVYVVYNGMMTRSLPAQITAMSLGCNKLSGVVEELSEEGFMLRVEIALEGEEGTEPQVFTESYFVLADGAMMEGLLVDMPVTVFHDGKMTRSIPAQVTAQHVRLMELEGVIDETTEEGFLMTDVNGMQYRVALMEGAQLFVTPAAGTAVRVAYNGVATMSIPALINAMEVLPVPAVETDLATATMID